ncbi:TonB-dependent receptor plug domain-containing protein [Aquimarina litoralis]
MKIKYTISLLFVLLFSLNTILPNTIKPVNITIYWDSSLSLRNKDKNRELEFLDYFFQKYPNCDVKLVTFSALKNSEDVFNVRSSKWDQLNRKLENVEYDGASDFSLIDIAGSGDFLFLFSDGKSNLGETINKLYTPRIITISSNKNVNKKWLHETAYYNKGYYVNLLENDISSSVRDILEKKVMSKLIFIDSKNAKPNGSKLIEGIVSDTYGNPVQDAYVSIKGKNKSTITDQSGAYKIAIDTDDILIFSAGDMKTAEVITDLDNLINVTLTRKINDLDPIVIKSKSAEEIDMVLIGDKKVNKRSLGYAVSNITSEDISDANRTLGESLAGEFAGVQLGNNNDAGQIIIRGFSSFVLSNHPTFIIDGMPLSRNESDMDFIDPNIIADITVLKGLAATNRYGTLGNNGVVLITTKMASLKKDKETKEEDSKPKIVYKNFSSPLIISEEKTSGFVTMLQSYNSVTDAYNHYLSHVDNNMDNVKYFIESASYFFDNGDKQKGLSVLSNLLELFPKDTSVLRVLAFHYEKYGLSNYAEKIYKIIMETSINDTQNYLDLANIYFKNKKYKESISLFKKITNNKIKEINSFSGLTPQINNDYRHLLSYRDQTWNVTNIKKSNFILPKHKLRVVTEWSHPQSEFEIQYINPDKHFFTLSHTKKDNVNMLNKEIAEGFLSDEYVLSDLKKGTWYLNLMVPEKQASNIKKPKYLKVKVYTDFGTTNQKLQTHLLDLDGTVKNQVFTSFTIN